MEEINCPLCCNQVFHSRESLIDHIKKLLANLTCPICQSKLSSLSNLIEHLSLSNCQLENTNSNLDIDEDSHHTEYLLSFTENSNYNHQLPINDKNEVSINHFTSAHDPSVNTEENKLYVELLNKQLKQSLHTQEFKIVNENGESRYLILTEAEAVKNDEIAIVTKQNSDGTISLTTENDQNEVSVNHYTSPETSKLYVQLENKELIKSSLHTQEFKLINENGESRFLILTDDTIKNNEIAIGTEHNNDTILLTPDYVSEMKKENESVISATNNELEDQEQTYSCNKCGVTFSSVLEHIQNYHNNQDVVVEGNIQNSNESVTENFASLETERVSYENETSHRVITDTGDLVETNMHFPNKNMATLMKEIDPNPLKVVEDAQLLNEKMADSLANSGSKKILKIDKSDNFVGDVKKGNSKELYHKVVMKEMQTLNESNKVKVYNCIACNIYVTDIDEFKKHPCKPPESVTTDNKFKCKVCNTDFSNNKSLKLHKRMHDPLKNRTLDPTMATQGSEEPSCDVFLCAICDKMIPVNYMKVHQNYHRNNYTCAICNRKFSSKVYLDMHTKVHSSEKIPVKTPDKTLPYTCVYCNRRFARPHEKVKHERIHTGERPHSCDICGKSFRVSYCLTLHMRTHTGARPYRCEHCGKRFKAHSVYNHHLRTHSEVRAYKCPFCPKAFKTSVQLAGHKNSHTKPFSCQHCNRPFASLYSVRVHTETHTRQNNLKFSCVLCGASYARTFALKDHMKQVHQKDLVNDSLVDTKVDDSISSDVIMKTEKLSQQEQEVDAVCVETETKI